MTLQSNTEEDLRVRLAKANPSPHKQSLWKLWLVLLVTLLLASSWLIFPYFVEGRKLLQDAGTQIQEGRSEQHNSLAQVLARWVDVPGDVEVEVLFATEEYFKRSSSPRIAAQYDTENYYVFMVTENTHIGELPIGIPIAKMSVDGVIYPSYKSEGPDLADHHRSTTIWVPKRGPDGHEIISEGSHKVELILRGEWDEENAPQTVSWEMPFSYPDQGGAVTSPMLIMALSAGVLSSTLTPCLIQLIIVFMATLTGLSAEQLREGRAVPAQVRRRVFLIALAFVVGVTFFYTLAGALIGYAGKSAQIAFEEYSREVAFGSGILVILMGIWMGIQSRAPLVCKIPMPRKMSNADTGGYFRSAIMAVGFSLGCMVCFSGSIMAILFIYVGVLGSAWVGALILFVFSLGVAIPFLAAAFFLSRTMSVMNWVSRYTPQIGLVSMLVIIGFGVILLLDQFHAVSDIIYPWLGLS